MHKSQQLQLRTAVLKIKTLTDSPFFLVLGASAAGFEADVAPAPPTDIPVPCANPWLVHVPAAAGPPANAVPFVSGAATAATAAAAAGVLVAGFDAAGAAEASIPLFLSANKLERVVAEELTDQAASPRQLAVQCPHQRRRRGRPEQRSNDGAPLVLQWFPRPIKRYI